MFRRWCSMLAFVRFVYDAAINVTVVDAVAMEEPQHWQVQEQERLL